MHKENVAHGSLEDESVVAKRDTPSSETPQVCPGTGGWGGAALCQVKPARHTKTPAMDRTFKTAALTRLDSRTVLPGDGAG